MTSRYRLDHRAFDRLVLCAPFMVDEMYKRALAVKERAESRAPFDPDDRDGVHYRDHFSAEAFVGESLKGIRAIGRVSNDDMPTALFVEFGTVHRDPNKPSVLYRTPRHRTLGNALDAASL